MRYQCATLILYGKVNILLRFKWITLYERESILPLQSTPIPILYITERS